MPELPDIEAYISALRRTIEGHTVRKVRLKSIFLGRNIDPQTNYCTTCQTGGKLLADRSLSRLLKNDWPRTPEELEEMRRLQ